MEIQSGIKNHLPMSNGTGLMGHKSATQTVLIAQQPGSNNLYYVFTTDATDNNGVNGLMYSVVDMSLDGGVRRNYN